MREVRYGDTRGIRETVRCYKRSSDLAYPQGMFNFAGMHEHGEFVALDLRETVRLCRLAADNGVGNASFILYGLYGDFTAGRGDRAVISPRCCKTWGCSATVLATITMRDRHRRCRIKWDQGRGCHSQSDEAMKYFKITAGNGFAPTMNQVGIATERDSGRTTS